MAGEVVVPSPPAAPRLLTLLTACRDATGASEPDQPGSRWTHGFTYGPENYTTGAVLDVCDTTTVDQPALPTPGTVTATPSATGGTLAAGGKGYRVVATRAGGHTAPSAEATPTTSGTTSKVTLTWAAVYGATGYDVYGRTAGSELKLASVTAPTYVDTGAATPSGALPVSNTTAGPGEYTNLASVVFQPYAIRAEDRCSTLGFGGRDYAGRALRQLAAVTPKQIEKEFWTGTLAQQFSYPNAYLTDGNAVDVTDTPGTAMSRAHAFEALEEAMATCGYGPRGMIHCQPRVIPNPNDLWLRREGNMLLTHVDTIVVPGIGYPGTAPNGSAPATGKTWAYATPIVDIRLDAPMLTPDPRTEVDWRFQALDRDRNDIVIRAQRFAAATYDPACIFAVLIDLAT